MDFAQRLSRLREKKGWSQYEVAQRLNIKRPRYNAWEQGISKPRADMLGKISDLFGVSIDDLLGAPAYDGPMSTVEEDFSDIDFDTTETIAAHHDGEDWTEEELEEIERFKEFVRSKRKHRR